MDERTLIQKCLAGDEEAYAQLMGMHREHVYQHCLSIVHDEASAEDLTQEAFLHAFTHLSSFRMEAHFSTWIWRIAHNLSLKYLKKQHPCAEFNEELASNLTEPKHEIDEEQLQEALRHLDIKHRLVFEMYEIQQIPQKEIALRLGISYGTVRSRLHYARKEIRKYF